MKLHPAMGRRMNDWINLPGRGKNQKRREPGNAIYGCIRSMQQEHLKTAVEKT